MSAPHWPLQLHSPMEELVLEVATELLDRGVADVLAFPAALQLVHVVWQAAQADDPQAGVAQFRKERQRSDTWWATHHPRTKRGRMARQRLKESGILSVEKPMTY